MNVNHYLVNIKEYATYAQKLSLSIMGSVLLAQLVLCSVKQKVDVFAVLDYFYIHQVIASRSVLSHMNFIMDLPNSANAKMD